MKARIKMCFVAVVSFLLFACVSNTPKDLMVSKVGIISRETLDEIIEVPLHESWLIDEFIIVGLATDTDLVEYVEERGYPLRVDRWFCEQESTPIFGGGLYSEGGSFYTRRINLENTNFVLTSVRESSGKNIYYALVPVTFSQDMEIYGRPERKGAVFYGKYNLMSNPRDLCFKIVGYAYGFGFKSNLVKFPASEIEGLADD